MGKTAVGVVVDTVTEVSTIPDEDIEKHMQVTANLANFIVGVGKQEDNLIVILDLAKIVSDIKDMVADNKETAVNRQLEAEHVPIV